MRKGSQGYLLLEPSTQQYLFPSTYAVTSFCCSVLFGRTDSKVYVLGSMMGGDSAGVLLDWPR
jgi:hypothetical protein